VEPRTSSIEIRLLGPVELAIEGRDVPLGGPRQRSLLALLAMRPGHVIPADSLVDEIWAGEPPEGADRTLRSYVSRLRRSLHGESSIDATHRGYVLRAPEDAVDALEFERLAREGADLLDRGAARQARERLGEALARWRGRPFGEVGRDGTLAAAAERLEERRLLALEQRIEADLALGRASELVDELEAFVREHPYRERAWRQLMLALYRAGRQADALAAYHRARTNLDEHLGIEPGEELRALETAILQQTVPAVAADGAEGRSLPAPVSSFVGREAELGELEERVRAARLVTLTGVGGVGKTRMALELARRTVAGYRDGAVFVDLSPLAEPSLVVGQVAAALDVREQPEADLEGRIAAHLRAAEALIVLDNCEHVREAAARLVERVLVACRDVRILATSRAPLGVPGETDFPVTPLSLASSPADSDAVSLFLARARSARPAIGDDAQTHAMAARICTDLEGLPLAIELAAARAKTLSLTEIAERLDDRFRFLVSWRRLTSARHRTLREAMDWSYELLAPDEQALLAGLSVFAGGFDLEAATAVCLDGDDDAGLRLVEALVDASLVTSEDGPAGTRYRLLDTVREYAAQHLAAAGLDGRLRDAHAAWALGLAEAAAPELGGERQGWWFARLEAEHNNLRAALAHLPEAGRALDHLRLAIALTRFWYVHGYLAEGRAALEQGLAVVEAGDPALRRRGLTAAASLALLQGEYAAATTFAEDGLAAARATGEERLVANALSNLGAIVLAAGDVERAGPLLDQAVEVGRRAGDERILALAVNNLGDYALTRGDHARARPLFEESLGLLRARGDTTNVARALFNLGAADLELGRHDAAAAHFREGLELAGDAGDREDLAWLLEGSAALAMARADAERAATLLGAAEALLAAMGADHKPYERSLRDRTHAAVVAALGEAAAEDLMRRGATLATPEAIELASTTHP
jgi:predicted ATPase/DNA-binding SARP family transcriptional activator